MSNEMGIHVMDLKEMGIGYEGFRYVLYIPITITGGTGTGSMRRADDGLWYTTTKRYAHSEPKALWDEGHSLEEGLIFHLLYLHQLENA